jgi:acyl carrier protein
MVDKLEVQIKNIMSAVFEIPVEEINDEASPETLEKWDSLKHMNLIVALEEEFKFTYSDEQTIEMLNYSLIYLITKNNL